MLDRDALESIAAEIGTPFYLYDAAGIRGAARALIDSFAWAPSFTEFFAVKAAPNPAILALLAEEGCGADCSSDVELHLAGAVGLRGARVMLTANNATVELYRHAAAMGATINLDDPAHAALVTALRPRPKTIYLRYNPGPAAPGNVIIGEPERSKFGMREDQILEAAAALQAAGIRQVGLHSMVVSNELDLTRLVANAQRLFSLAVRLHAATGIMVAGINLGGGIGIPYRPGEAAVPLPELGAAIQSRYRQSLGPAGLDGVPLSMECGRVITGPHGILVCRVRNIKESYRTYVGIDATMADLMRPALYGAHHRISVPGQALVPEREWRTVDVVGSLCENNDKFAIERKLPPVAPGDLLVLHDVGAHGRAMGFNYNGALRPPEVLLEPDGQTRLIRRRETVDDYLATLRVDGMVEIPTAAVS